jgi:hypothetical protein
VAYRRTLTHAERQAHILLPRILTRQFFLRWRVGVGQQQAERQIRVRRVCSHGMALHLCCLGRIEATDHCISASYSWHGSKLCIDVTTWLCFTCPSTVSNMRSLCSQAVVLRSICAHWLCYTRHQHAQVAVKAAAAQHCVTKRIHCSLRRWVLWRNKQSTHRHLAAQLQELAARGLRARCLCLWQWLCHQQA